MTAFRLLVERSLRVVPNPSRQELPAQGNLADPKALPILVAAARERCQWLVTFNVGDFVQRVRTLLTHLDVTK